MISARYNSKLYSFLTSAPTLVVIISLSINVFFIDLISTQRWTAYIKDFDRRLESHSGLIQWEKAAQSSSYIDDINWKMVTIDWTLPIMCIILARNGQVGAIFDYPPWTTFRPLDLGKLDQLPSLQGVNYDTYKNTFTMSKE